MWRLFEKKRIWKNPHLESEKNCLIQIEFSTDLRFSKRGMSPFNWWFAVWKELMILSE